MQKPQLEPKLIRLEAVRIRDVRVAPLPHLVARISREATQGRSDRASPIGCAHEPLALHDLAWNHRIFIVRIGCAESMIPVRNDDFPLPVSTWHARFGNSSSRTSPTGKTATRFRSRVQAAVGGLEGGTEGDAG